MHHLYNYVMAIIVNDFKFHGKYQKCPSQVVKAQSPTTECVSVTTTARGSDDRLGYFSIEAMSQKIYLLSPQEAGGHFSLLFYSVTGEFM